MTWQSFLHTAVRPILQRAFDPGVFLPQKNKLSAVFDDFLTRYVTVQQTNLPIKRGQLSKASYIAQNIDLNIEAINVVTETSRPAPRFAKLRRVFERSPTGDVVVSKSLERWYSSVPLSSQLTNSEARRALLELHCWELFDFQMRE